ncbi:GDP-L-fucose synthase [Nitrospirillum sp. BR 11164]|uniref:GDP-L-fucose synthase n=1 Tax=Nitrospirillum sp. BR 11164 TaxID=3104324 RepID=UPI002AFFEBDF|nr:GDP-L-fucose synthase [Nitrospirillum sp. BR 11164]MEA1652702.1 GDP-L-fucose synthase [Nitrospirillum sp. BR 11164]
MHKPPYELRNKRVWVAGHRGLVGAALVRRLEREGCDILTVGRHHCDLRNGGQVDKWMKDLRPDAVFLAAAHVGGIHANDTRPAEFIYDNLMIEANIIDSAHRSGVEKLLFLGSSCIYPRMAPQPIPEEALLTGPLEPTNQWYAIAKIAGIKLCQAYRRQYGCDFTSVMPTNLYGPGDNFDLMASHVVPALMVKAHKAKQEGAKTLEIWGSGTPLRELLFVDDAADGMVFVMKHYSEEEPLNLGSSQEVSIAELAERICRVVGFQGEIVHDRSKPDGTPRKIMDNSRLEALGWRAPTSIDDGLAQTYRWYVDNIGSVRGAPVVHA